MDKKTNLLKTLLHLILAVDCQILIPSVGNASPLHCHHVMLCCGFSESPQMHLLVTLYLMSLYEEVES